MKAVFYIGLPGSGKSTDIKERKFLEQGYSIISADVLKEGHPNYNPLTAHEIHEWSVEEAENLVYKAVEAKHDIVFDSGGINNSYSMRIMGVVKDAGYHITLIFINTPIVECLKRINTRTRKVPFKDIFEKSFKMKSCLVKQKEMADEYIESNYYKEENFVFDMDGVLVEYQAFPLKCEFAPADTVMDYINNNVFEFAEPVTPIVYLIKTLIAEGKQIFILSVSPNSSTTEQKLKWLKKHIPELSERNIYFVGNGERKVNTLFQIMKKNKINISDYVYVDDIHTMLWDATNHGVNAYHPSTFLARYYK